MKIKRTSKIFIVTIGAMAVIVLLIWAFIGGRKEFETKQERPVKASSRVRFEEGRVEVKIDSSEQAKSGIVTETVPLSSHQQQFKAYGTVVPIQQLADAFQNYASAKAQTKKAIATASASRREYLRIKDLYEKKLESDRTLQTVEADWQSDDATAQAAESVRLSLESLIRQQWGETIARWVYTGSAELHKILKHQNVLIEVTLSADEKLSSEPEAHQPLAEFPRAAFVQQPSTHESPAKVGVRAQFVSSAQSADSRFQGQVLFYLASSPPNALLGGMNVDVFLSTGDRKDGIVVPRSAAVWWQGKAWVYAEKRPHTFVRLELPTDQPLETDLKGAGWFVPNDREDFSGPLRIVTRGAQLLLSEEFRSQIQVGEEGGKK